MILIQIITTNTMWPLTEVVDDGLIQLHSADDNAITRLRDT